MLRRAAGTSAIAGVSLRRLCTPYKGGQPPLTQWFAGDNTKVNVNPDVSAPLTEPLTVSKMPNGARVISEHRGGAAVSIGAYILAGPAYDPVPTPGLGSVLHHALRNAGNPTTTPFQLEQKLNAASASCTSFDQFKHYIGIRVDAQPNSWKKGKPTLLESNLFATLASPKLPCDKELDELQLALRSETVAQRLMHPACYAINQLETVAFFKHRLGASSFVPECAVPGLNAAALETQYNRYVIPSRIVIAGVNVSHHDLVAAYENCSVIHSESSEHHQKAIKEMGKVYNTGLEAAQYTGGERQDADGDTLVRLRQSATPQSFVAVGWLGFGRQIAHQKEYAASMVVRSLLSNAFRQRYPVVSLHQSEEVKAFYRPYQAAGLLGFTVVSSSADATKLVTEASSVVKNMAKGVAPEVLEMAKAEAQVAFSKMYLDSARDYCNFIGTSLPQDPSSSSAMLAEDVLANIGKTDVADVKGVLSVMLSKPSSLYAHGDTLPLPSAQQMGL